jgi:hypothetical protein
MGLPSGSLVGTVHNGCASAICVAVLLLPTLAQADVLGASAPDLSVAAVRHWAECPLPKEGNCVIRKPVDTGYRVLTSRIDLEDMGDHWVADFHKLKAATSRELLFRVLGRNGDMHEIVVRFPEEPAPPPKPPAKKKRRLNKPAPKPPAAG